ncbi:MAG: hypothetical protein NTY19_50955 [Planctomycetota bacterium]|nr:hypothetical protein [Planctomycetota bacterium]
MEAHSTRTVFRARRISAVLVVCWLATLGREATVQAQPPPTESILGQGDSPLDDFSASDGQASATPGGRHLIVGLPIPRALPNGTLVMEPNVEVTDTPPPAATGGAFVGSGTWLTGPESAGGSFPGGNAEESRGAISGPFLPGSPTVEYFSVDDPNSRPVFERALDRLRRGPGHSDGFLGSLFGGPISGEDAGVGRERLAYAPFEMDISQPLNNFRLRLDSVHGFPLPDRSEYFWAKPGKGPTADTGVSYQDVRFLSEVATGKFSVLTDVPIRVLEPDHSQRTTGLSDVNLATKVVLLDGRSWQITQLFRTYFPTGAMQKGLGNGHFSLEPGMLARVQCTPDTYLHAQLKYWVPLGGDPIHSGQVLTSGLGYSHLVLDWDRFAVLHTGEFIDTRFLDGQATVNPLTGQTALIGGQGSFQFYPGLRFVFDRGCDLGLFELGIAGTFSMGSSSLYDPLVRVDLRWSY